VTRRTSKDAYERIKAEGLLGRRQWQVYDALFRQGPMTANQVYELLKREDSITWISNQGAGSRLSELREMGCVSECGVAVDPFTKMSVIRWDVTEHLPIRPEKRISKDQQIKQLKEKIEWLEQQNSHLKSEMDRLNRGELF